VYGVGILVEVRGDICVDIPSVRLREIGSGAVKIWGLDSPPQVQFWIFDRNGVG
jgi:hypothetical protein